MTAIVRSNKTEFHIGTTSDTPATDDYVEIAGVRQADGALGAVYSQIDVTTLSDAFVQTVKGVAEGGTLTLGGPLIRDDENELDEGQAALKAAADDGGFDSQNFKIVGSDGAIEYFRGRVFSFTVQVGSNSNVREFRATIRVLGLYTTAAAA